VPANPVQPVEEKNQKQAASPSTPKYGGTLHVSATTDPNGFDPGVRNSLLTTTIYWTHDTLIAADWAKGPAGTGQTNWLNYIGLDFSLLRGSLAESWDLPDGGTIVFHLRKGVHFWNKPPVNGREVTSDDVVFSLKREWDFSGSYNRSAWSPETIPTSIKALDKYTVEVKIAPAVQALQILNTGTRIFIVPQEAIKAYGNMDNWKNVFGTGPFILTDYVPGSGLSYTSNPDYFQTDPMHPQNHIPYIDGFKQLIIPDVSTRLAAFRTGKLETIVAIQLEDAKQLTKQIPALMKQQKLGAMTSLKGKVDKASNLPFQDLRVRLAMNLAVDRKAILNNVYQGDGILMGWPWYPIKEHTDVYVPLEKLPADAQEMFSYNPDKAKQLLAEAGYKSGFKTQVLAMASQVDMLSILKDYLSKVNIDLTINVVPDGVYNPMLRAKTFPEMIFAGSKMYFLPWMMHEVRQESFDDVTNFEAPETRAAYNELMLVFGKDDAKSWQILKNITPFMIANDPVGIYMPMSYTYDLWWPWLQNWFDATALGYWEPNTNYKYSWIDQDLKKSMGY
jgi:peptide/nickel transport system substrate-binding protein